MNLPFRAMVSDLDGTLLTPEHLVGDLTIDTLRALEQKGVDIILATGRNHTDVSSILGKIGAERAVMITSMVLVYGIYRVICFIAIAYLKN